ncbi:MAG: hypothetical protein ACD_10C00800G0001 [uncultured bacterium]|nr:MAG: hypothetical protein ACD_10C00800G0001 [uncultured bacterium]
MAPMARVMASARYKVDLSVEKSQGRRRRMGVSMNRYEAKANTSESRTSETSRGSSRSPR